MKFKTMERKMRRKKERKEKKKEKKKERKKEKEKAYSFDASNERRMQGTWYRIALLSGCYQMTRRCKLRQFQYTCW
jgi:hypothetical protein